jgi:phospholipid transport system substrate-binding protein
MKKLFALILLAVLPGLVLADAAPQDPQAVVQSAVTALTARLQAERPKLKDNSELLYSIINENITPYVDINGIAKRVMGQYYRQSTDQQRLQFAATFKDSMIRTYANGLASYNNQKITFMPYRAGDDPAIAQVDVQVTGDTGTIYPVTFQMKKDAQGNWKAQNLIVNGINLGLTFRNQFAAAVGANNGSIDKAIAGWAPDTRVVKGKAQ